MEKNKQQTTTNNVDSKNISLRKELSKILFLLEGVKVLDRNEFNITQGKLPGKETLLVNFSRSEVGQISEQLYNLRKRLEQDMTEMDIDIQKLVERGGEVPEADRLQILQEFEGRKKKGTINEKQLALTIALEKRVRTIQKIGKDVERILNSSKLKSQIDGEKDINKIPLQEYKVSLISKNSLRPSFKNRKFLVWSITLLAIFISFLIVLIVVFVVL